MASPEQQEQARRALVVYGSETGNAQDVAEEMGRVAERLRFDTEVAELNAVSLVCCSTLHITVDSVDQNRNNCCNMKSFSLPSPPPARVNCPPTVSHSGGLCEVLASDQDVCSA